MLQINKHTPYVYLEPQSTSLMASFGVLDPQLFSSNTTQDKKVKQNTFVLQGD